MLDHNGSTTTVAAHTVQGYEYRQPTVGFTHDMAQSVTSKVSDDTRTLATLPRRAHGAALQNVALQSDESRLLLTSRFGRRIKPVHLRESLSGRPENT